MTGASMTSARGIALVAVLLVSGLVFVIASGLTLLSSVGHLAARNHRDAARLEAAARAGVQLAAGALEHADWSGVLAGSVVAAGVDGTPAGVRHVHGRPLDLAAETHLINCGRTVPCSSAQRALVTLERPWGANNPFWQLFLFGPLSSLAAFRHPPDSYVLAWVADDSREDDERPDVDGEGAGRHVLRVRAMAVGPQGTRRTAEAEVVRVCLAASLPCEPGIRVQSERDITHALP